MAIADKQLQKILTDSKRTKTTKELYAKKIIEYLSDPNNKQITRTKLTTKILGLAHTQQLYKHFSMAELNNIEWAALDLRRSRYASFLSEIDRALIKKARSGDTNAMKLAYQRFEGWAPPKEIKINANMTVNISSEDAVCL